MKPVWKSLLSLAVLLLALLLFGCWAENDIVSPPLNTQVVARSDYSYALTLSAEKATIDIQDSIHWHPHVAYLSLTVTNSSAGGGTLEIRDSSGVQVCSENFEGRVEVLNRKLTSAMPLRLHLSLHGFTGVIVCNLSLGPTEINGLVARLALRDSTGVERSSFRAGERMDFFYSVVNMTARSVRWAKGDSRPMCRFTISRADSLLWDSFYGLAFLQVPESGELEPGDSVRVVWHRSGSPAPLAPGHYTAMAEPQFIFTELGFLGGQERSLEIIP